MRQLGIRILSVACLASFAVLLTGCDNAKPSAPVEHKAGSDGGLARPHGEPVKGAGKKSPPRLDD